MSFVLETFNLSKRYKQHWALKGVNMHVSRGDIYGFVGENGSGKTTVIRCVTGLIFPNEGGIALFGVRDDEREILAQRKRVGAIVETPSIYLNMSAAENLRLQCSILGITEGIEERTKLTLEEVGLGELYENKKRVSNFSLGMRQRLGIAMALLGKPELIILDEPMNGLDPAGIVEVRELILKLNREQEITFLISSHILSELELVATKYGIISKGRLIKEITAEELQRECRASVLIQSPSAKELHELLAQMLPHEDCVAVSGGVRVYGDIDLNEVLRDIINEGIKIDSIVCSRAGIEEYYLSLVGGAGND